MSHLFLIRHGTSFFNEINLVAGSMDVPLSKAGIEQSENLASRINSKLDIVYTSNLTRSIVTANILLSNLCSRFNQIPVFLVIQNASLPLSLPNVLPVYKTGLLNERNYGQAQGRKKDSIKRIMSTMPKFFEAESIEEVKQRTDFLFYNILKKDIILSKNIAIIGHQNSLKTLRATFEDSKKSINEYKLLKNCEVIDYII